MRLLLDQDVYAVTARFLRERGHDVVTASELGLAEARDEELLFSAKAHGRVLVTRDRHFGSLVFLRRFGTGVIYLRLVPSEIAATHEELARVLSSYTEDEARSAFIVVEPGRHRFRRLPA